MKPPLGLTLQVRAMKQITSGEVITQAIAAIDHNKTVRKLLIQSKGLPDCQCDKCRLNLDEDLDYEEYHKLMTKFFSNMVAITHESTGPVVNKDYQIDWHLIMYLRAIYGEYKPRMSQLLIIFFCCFAQYSRIASKSLINLWYKEIEPSVYITHGSDHPTYKLLLSIYQNKCQN